MTRRALLVITLITCLLTEAGCWSQRNVTDLAFVMGMGFDAPPEGSLPGVTDLLSVQIAVTSAYGEQGGQGEPVMIVASTGIGPSDANLNLSKEISRTLYYGHTQVVIFGEEKARDGLDANLDVLERAVTFRRSMLTFVAKGKAVDIFEAKPKLESIGSLSLPRMAQKTTVSSFVVPVGDFVTAVEDEYIEAAVPMIGTGVGEGAKPEGGGEKGGQGSGGQPGGQEGGGKPEPEKRLRVEGIALFRGSRMVGTLFDDEADGFLLATNRFGGHRVTLRTQRFGKVQAVLNQAKAGIRTVGPADHPRLVVEATARMALWEATTPRDFLKAEVQREVEGEVTRYIRRAILDAIQSAQKVKSDVFGFGAKIFRKDPQAWRRVRHRWADIFAEADVTVKVKVTLSGTSSIVQPGQIHY